MTTAYDYLFYGAIITVVILLILIAINLLYSTKDDPKNEEASKIRIRIRYKEKNGDKKADDVLSSLAENYIDRYLQAGFLERRKGIYVGYDTQQKLRRIINYYNVEGVTVSHYADRIIQEHLILHEAEIEELLRQRTQEPL